MDLTADAHKILLAAIDAVKPENLIRRRIKRERDTLSINGQKLALSTFRNIFVVGAGKASAAMAAELEKIIGNRITAGAVVTKYDHAVACRQIRIYEGGHPVLDENGLAGSNAVFELVNRAGADDLVISLISGGGSALLEKLPPGISLKQLQKTFQRLLECGAAIEEINAVRKHLSLIKGGQLARAIAPATALTLIISDVIGDPLDAIASGPTAPDPTTFETAWGVIQKYRLEEKLPGPVAAYLVSGVSGKHPETLKSGDPLFSKVRHFILGNNYSALTAARETARKGGYKTLLLSSRIQGEAREVARVLAAVAQEISVSGQPVAVPACVLAGGETTVTLRGNGKGGRNQELALAALIALQNHSGSYVIASCGSDGTDGPTDAAGGIASPQVLAAAREKSLSPQNALENNDAYPFLAQCGGLIKTGPTGTNVMDIMLVMVA